MAERTTLQKQSLSAPRLLAQLFRPWRGFGRFILRQQICRWTRIKSREPKESYKNQSYFQDGFTLVTPSSFGAGIKPGPTFCTAALLWCQEVRYFMSVGHDMSVFTWRELWCGSWFGFSNVAAFGSSPIAISLHPPLTEGAAP